MTDKVFNLLYRRHGCCGILTNVCATVSDVGDTGKSLLHGISNRFDVKSSPPVAYDVGLYSAKGITPIHALIMPLQYSSFFTKTFVIVLRGGKQGPVFLSLVSGGAERVDL